MIAWGWRIWLGIYLLALAMGLSPLDRYLGDIDGFIRGAAVMGFIFSRELAKRGK